MSVVESRNEVTDPNGLPGGPASLVGNGSTVTQVADPLAAPGTSYRMAHTSVATGGGLVVAGAVTPGQRWHGRVKMHRTSAELGARRLGCQLYFQDAAGNSLLDDLAASVVESIPAGVFTRWTGSANASRSERYEGTSLRVNDIIDPLFTNSNAWYRNPSATYDFASIPGAVAITVTTALAANGALVTYPAAGQAVGEFGSPKASAYRITNTGPTTVSFYGNTRAYGAAASTDGPPSADLVLASGASGILKIPAVTPTGDNLQGYRPLIRTRSAIPVGHTLTVSEAIGETVATSASEAGPFFTGATTNTGSGTDLASYDLAVSATAPVGAVRAVLYPYREQAYQATAADVTHAFNLMLTQASRETAPPYGDGDSPGWFWSGARAASASYSLTAQGIIVEPDAGRMGVQLLDAKGVLWDLINGPVRLTRAGLKGLGLPDIVYFTSESAGLDGERVTGWRLKAREVFAPVRFKDEAMADTTGLQRTFWDGLQINRPIQIIVTDRNGAVRTLTMRVADDGGLSYKMSPDLLHVDSIGLGFTAADPWWYGPAVEARYTIGADTGADFFGGDANAPDFNIVSAGGSTATTVTNPGEEPMWLKWTIGGPSSQFRVGVGGKRISQSLVIPSGQWLVIDTDPRVQTAYLGATKIPFRAFSELNFAPVPPGADVPVTIEIVGQGLITAQGRPKYRRAI